MNATDPSLPWWASRDGDADSNPDADPVELHRAARRGAHDRDGSARAEADGDDPATSSHAPDVCGVCPICTGLRLLGETHPELLDHLGEAARHLAAAARVLLESPADNPDDDAARDTFTRIEVE